ncbi:MAG: HD-GYP domain-containing protein [Capsulimonas sp.]|uniref:HD-GYP domain-containing protein n=1 Tax=Capsulimonas sp. TaxID=2494211 RepID=UPI00326565A7
MDNFLSTTYKLRRRRFKQRVTSVAPYKAALLAGFVLLVASCVSSLALYYSSLSAAYDGMRAELRHTAAMAATVVDADRHKDFILPAQESTPEYRRAIAPLQAMLIASGDMKFIYTCVLRNNKVFFVLDPTPAGDADGDGVDDKSHIMEEYPEAPPPMLRALRTGIVGADAKVYPDRWGSFMSGYAPIRDSHGHCVGIVGVDMNATQYTDNLSHLRHAVWAGLGVALLMSLAVTICVYTYQRNALIAGAERLASAEALRKAHEELRQTNNELEERVSLRTAELLVAYNATIEGWSRALEMRDHETEGHCRRVTELTLRMGQALGMGEDQLNTLRQGALLHDIGKMGIPDEILLKPGALTEAEWVVMRLHPEYAVQMLQPIEFLEPALDIPRYHHEKWDGTGYPRGLSGEEIPLAARLFAFVDVWDALRSDRPYRRAWSHDRVCAHIRGLAGTHFDPTLTEIFLRVVEEGRDESEGWDDLQLAA